MPELAMLSLQKAADKSWQWTAYDEHGQTMGTQTRCEDVGTALENALQWLFPPTPTGNESTKPQPPTKATRSPRHRKPRNKASSHDRK
jgi:hypothetical protein